MRVGCGCGCVGGRARLVGRRVAMADAEDATEVLAVVALQDVPRVVVAPVTVADRLFRGLLRGGGIAVFVVTGLIAVFLVTQSWGSLRRAGWRFFTTSAWLPASGHFG